MPDVKRDTTPPAHAAEVLAFALAIGVVNWFFPGDPGFLRGVFNPYIALSFLIAVSHGKYYGFLALGYSALIVAVGLPLSASIWSGHGIAIPAGTWADLSSAAPLPFAAAILQVYVLGIIRDSLTRRDRKARDLLVSLSRDKGLLKRQVRALREANLELEERVSRQEDSITSLYSQVQVLGSLNLNKTIGAILELTARYVGATRCSIWQHLPREKSLAFVAGKGWEQGAEILTLLPDEGTIEGWVVRNGGMFSVKMLLTNEVLARLDTGRNIITMPIIAGRRTWGVLNIEEMPFAKYNLYSERLLQVIMTLVAPALDRAIEFESVLRQEDINPVTGLPSFPELYAMLQLELARLSMEGGTLAVLVLELANMDDLVKEHGREQTLLLLREIARVVQESSGGPALVFHYKAESQLGVLYPKLDSDGASHFSLSVLAKVNSTEWKVKNERVFLELMLGFAARSGAGQSADALLEAAENLLEMQKV
jgi:GGDEF domain-containing protein